MPIVPDTPFVPPMVCNTPLDIVVPTHNHIELTIKCINAIYAYTSAPFHLIVVDDSTDGITPIYFENLKKEKENLTFVHSDEPYPCGNRLFNIGFSHGTAKYTATIMNSVTVEPEWEVVALKLLEEDPKIGIVGLKSLFAIDGYGAKRGWIESAGITMVGYTPVDIGRDLPSHRLTSIYECPSVQWAFAIVRKEAAIGNMAENVYNAFRGWDDIDNSFTLRKNGWKVVYCGYGVGYHHPRATRGSMPGDKQSHDENRQNARMFYKRWGFWKQFKKDYPKEAKRYEFEDTTKIKNLNQ